MLDATRVGHALESAGADEPTCTPGSVAAHRYRCGGGDHPSWPVVAGGLTRPTRRLGRAALERLLCGLAPDGVYRAAAVACGAGGLLPHRFTLTGHGPAVCSLWHCPAGHPGWLLATALLCGARTFLDPRRSAVPRPPGRLVRTMHFSVLTPIRTVIGTVIGTVIRTVRRSRRIRSGGLG